MGGAEPGEIRRRFLGQPTYFEAKAEEENSMSVKRRMFVLRFRLAL